ncbi:MAG: hypothetical protein E6G61_06190 [Actinobacteria bacterium]|nr:MAG: hypothetical protein E6G61_06190 [Actinomycetota bacterium]
MRKVFLLVTVVLALVGGPAADAASVSIQASPNPARLGDRVTHTVGASAYGYLIVWISARGFGQPGLGSLPPGTWRLECCPSETAGTAAWHYRSNAAVGPATYRFGATARSRGTFLSTARLGISTATVWVRIT